MSNRFYIAVAFIALFSCSTVSQDLIPFSLPWDDGEPSITDASHLLEKPAGKHGFIHVDGAGRFVDGAGDRIRFLGVNTSFSGGFPPKPYAERVAQRLAKFGINCVRIHHHDTLRAPNGIWKEGVSAKQELDPGVIDRLDYFIHQLKENGIYVNLNLKVGREVVNADGFTQTDQLPTYDKGPDHYFPRMIELQKHFARDYLGRVNPYTGLSYIEDPAVAMIELNNESGLLTAWRNNDIDDMPEQYIEPLEERWNAFLGERYASTDALRQSWQPQQSGSGQELLAGGLNGWFLQQLNDARAQRMIDNNGPDGAQALHAEVTTVGAESWYVQLLYQNLAVEGEKVYKAVLWMKADSPTRVDVGIRQNHDPWQFLDATQSARLTREWQRFEFLFSLGQSDSNARMDIGGFGGETGTISISQTSLTESQFDGLPEGESLEDTSVSWLARADFARKSPQAKADWYDFLIEVETQYNIEMRDFLRNELGVQVPVTGSQLGFSTLLSQMPHDYIDDHAYWHHPSFPGQPWDSQNWHVQNESIVETLDNSLLRMMHSRIEGKPFTVSEYNHSAPNTYSSEAIPLLAAFAAFQDWDGIFYYSYSHNTSYPHRSIDSFFDIAGHTPKMMGMPAAANMFHRGDIEIGREPVIGVLTRDERKARIMERSGALWQRPLEDTDVPEYTPYMRRTSTRVVDQPETVDIPDIQTSSVLMETDTGHITFRKRGPYAFFKLTSPLTKGYIGFDQQRSVDLYDGVRMTLGETRQGWANVLLTMMKEDGDGQHWLLTATGYAENNGMVWKNDEKTSVGNQWGDGPPLVEAIPLSIEWDQPGIKARLFTLDERGMRVNEIASAVGETENGVRIDLMNQPPALWYELLIFDPSVVTEAGLHE